MELYDAMSTLRAVRRLRSDPIDDEIVQRILTAATWAPTGGNMQPWRIVVVTDADKKQRLEDLYRPHWDSYLPGYEKKIAGAPDSIRKPAERAMEAGNYLANHMHEVPMIAVFCYNPGIMTITDSKLGRPSVVGGGSVYPAVKTSCWLAGMKDSAVSLQLCFAMKKQM